MKGDEEDEDEEDEGGVGGDVGLFPSILGASSTPIAIRTSAAVGRRRFRPPPLILPGEGSSEEDPTADVATPDLDRLLAGGFDRG